MDLRVNNSKPGQDESKKTQQQRTITQYLARANQFIDRFLPAENLAADAETRRRYRLLVVISLGLLPFALFFAHEFYKLYGLSINTLVLFLCSVFLLIPPLLLRLTKSHIIPSLLLLGELLVVLSFLIYTIEGLHSPALIWLSVIPITATILFSPRAGFISVILIVIELSIFYLLNLTGFTFPEPFSHEQEMWFHFLTPLTEIKT